jgi:hypothetical protein
VGTQLQNGGESAAELQKGGQQGGASHQLQQRTSVTVYLPGQLNLQKDNDKNKEKEKEGKEQQPDVR